MNHLLRSGSFYDPLKKLIMIAGDPIFTSSHTAVITNIIYYLSPLSYVIIITLNINRTVEYRYISLTLKMFSFIKEIGSIYLIKMTSINV